MASAPNPNANPNLSSANGNGAGPTPSSSSSSTPTPGAGAPNPRRMPSMSSERTISATRSLSPDGTNTTPAQPSIIKRAVQSTANKLSPSRRTSLISASGTLSTSIPAAGAVGNSTATSTSSATKMSASSGPGGTSSNASGSSRLASALRKSNKLANTPKNTSTASTTPQSSIRSTSTTATRPAPVTHASSESSDNDLEPIPSTPTAMFKSTPGMGATPSSSAGPRQTHSLARSHAAFTRPPMDGSVSVHPFFLFSLFLHSFTLLSTILLRFFARFAIVYAFIGFSRLCKTRPRTALPNLSPLCLSSPLLAFPFVSVLYCLVASRDTDAHSGATSYPLGELGRRRRRRGSHSRKRRRCSRNGHARRRNPFLRARRRRKR
ncbi:hypothetical protein DL93DRAFT_1693549 [Clavulina sp. PMI_390]|nr:hypothetical protein DL93DRAFT_1693549 [Clavulina sp. PMI_390]